MMQKIVFFLLAILLSAQVHSQDFITTYEKSNGKQSAPYHEVIDFYQKLANKYPTVDIKPAGGTDVSEPLHVVFFSNNGNFSITNWKQQRKVLILINNGIHPGEPDGIDATMMLIRDAAIGKIKIPDNIVLAVVPVFNIGGALNRNSYSRANQNGPEAYGFRGNAQNLDLNRDFIKMDAKETQTLIKTMHLLDPDLFLDNHVSNGADYQHIMTLLSTQHSKLGGEMGKYLHNILEPQLYTTMKKRGYNLVPYVNVWGTTPDSGWQAFSEGPRFASGYAAMQHIYAFVSETHMLKPYKKRVDATYALMESFIKVASQNADEILKTRQLQKSNIKNSQKLPIDWTIDTTRTQKITFRGYEAGYKKSEVSGLDRLYYDRTKPYKKEISFYNYFIPSKTATVPKAYVIPQGWHNVVEKLRLNNVKVDRLNKDSVLTTTVYYINNYETVSQPYEGHYLHYNVSVRTAVKKLQLHKGDYIIPTNQDAKRYIVEVLEPTAPDAFFAWGFFDAILQQKEHFSSYVFEDVAAEILKKKPKLKQQLDDKKKADTSFANNARAQLDFVYKHSPYYEPVHLRYPVYRIE